MLRVGDKETLDHNSERFGGWLAQKRGLHIQLIVPDKGLILFLRTLNLLLQHQPVNRGERHIF